MKTKIIIALMAILALSSCSQNLEDLHDTIKPSKTKHTFDAEGGNLTVTTQGKAWFYEIACNLKYYRSENIKYPMMYEKPLPDTIKGPWFWVAWQEEKLFIIHADANDTADQRKFSLTLGTGNYDSHVYITQEGKAN